MNKLLGLLLTVLFVPLTSIADSGWDDLLYKQIEQSIQRPQIAGKTYLITKYGAKPETLSDKELSTRQRAIINQKAIQKAIDKCSAKGGGQVVVPAGCKFLTAAIRLKSGVNLVVQENATLEFVFEPDLYPIVETSWEGLDCYNLSPCIYAFQANDIALTGLGTIDGGGSNDTWWPWCGAPRYGWKEGMIAQKIEARPRLLRNGEDGIPMVDEQGKPTKERTFGPKDGLRPQLVCFNQCQRILIEILHTSLLDLQTVPDGVTWLYQPVGQITVDAVTDHIPVKLPVRRPLSVFPGCHLHLYRVVLLK